MQILEVVGSLAIGGAERVAVEIAAGLPKPEFQAEILCLSPDAEAGTTYERTIESEANARGVPVSRLAFPSPFDGPARRKLAAFLAGRRWDLVHVHSRPLDWQVAVLARLLGVPAIFTLHLPYDSPRRRQRLLRATAARAARAVVCVSRTVAEHAIPVEHIGREKIHVIYNGIRTDVFRPAPPGERAAKRRELGLADSDVGWLCAARMSEQKAHHFLIDAMARLPRQARSRLLLAGDGTLRPALEEQAKRLGLGPRVVFLGARNDVPALLGAVDGYVCSSLQEGHPLSILEAMAVGLPVVAPRIGAIVEIELPGNPLFFGPAITGWARQHDPAEIAATLMAAERNLPDHAARALALRSEIALRYAPEAMLRAHADLYRRVGGRRSIGVPFGLLERL